MTLGPNRKKMTDFEVSIETMFPGPYTAYSGRLLGGEYYKRDEVCFNNGLIHEPADQMTQALVRG